MSKCATCSKEYDIKKSIVVSGKIINGCNNCIESQVIKASDGHAKYSREWQKKEYRKDLLQPSERDFVKAYGVDTAREWGLSDDSIRKLS